MCDLRGDEGSKSCLWHQGPTVREKIDRDRDRVGRRRRRRRRADDAFDDELDVKGPPRVLLSGPAT